MHKQRTSHTLIHSAQTQFGSRGKQLPLFRKQQSSTLPLRPDAQCYGLISALEEPAFGLARTGQHRRGISRLSPTSMPCDYASVSCNIAGIEDSEAGVSPLPMWPGTCLELIPYLTIPQLPCQALIGNGGLTSTGVVESSSSMSDNRPKDPPLNPTVLLSG